MPTEPSCTPFGSAALQVGQPTTLNSLFGARNMRVRPEPQAFADRPSAVWSPARACSRTRAVSVELATGRLSGGMRIGSDRALPIPVNYPVCSQFDEKGSAKRCRYSFPGSVTALVAVCCVEFQTELAVEVTDADLEE
jgi:hypothetical protein